VGKTHFFSLFYGAASGDGALLAHGPVLALAAPGVYLRSKVFGPVEEAAGSPVPAVEQTLAAHIAEAVVGQIGLGFENYGDHSSSGYVKGTYLWDNNEYDLPAGALLHFFRTGDRGALCAGLVGAQHFVDVDRIHYSYGHPEWVGAAHTHSHGAVGHHTADAPNMHHAGYVLGLIWSTYLTGNPDGLDGAVTIAEWVLRNIRPEANVGQMERAMGLPLMTLNDVYEATGDERFLRGAARLAAWALRWEHPTRSGFLAPITEQPAYYSGAPFCGGLLSNALSRFNDWAGDPELEALLERVGRWLLTDMGRPPGRIMSKGGSPRRGADAQHVATHLPLLRRCYLRTGDPLFLLLPASALRTGFGTRARPFGTRATGLVFNHAPAFFPLLRGWEETGPGADLELRAIRPHVRLRPGETATVEFLIRNRGRAPGTELRVAFQPRLDYQVVAPPESAAVLAPGESRTVRCRVRAPSGINLTSQHNRISYAHLCVACHQAGRRVPARATVQMELTAGEPLP